MGGRTAEKLVPGGLVGAEGLRPLRAKAWAGLGFRGYCLDSEGGEVKAHRALVGVIQSGVDRKSVGPRG